MSDTQQPVESSLRLRLRPYQTAGADWIYDRLSQQDKAPRAVLLCDDPGLGKSVQTLLAMLRLGIRRAVIVAPTVGRRVWQQEIETWVPEWSSRVRVIEPGADPAVLRDLDAPDCLVLVSYATFSETKISALHLHRWDLLVLDEAHFLKGASNRTWAIYGRDGQDQGLQAQADRVLLLTGTPTPNHAGELWHHIRALWPDILSMPNLRAGVGPKMKQLAEHEYLEHVTEYRDTNWGRQVIRSRNQTWLRERMRRVVLHRSKARVLPELPPVQCQDIPLAVNGAAIDAALTPQEQVARLALASKARRMSDEDIIRALQAVPAHGALSAVRHALGAAKVEATVEWVTERLSCGTRKLILFGWHRDVLEALHEKLGDYTPVLVTGTTAAAARAVAIERFQTHPLVRVFVGQLLATGTAVTLTAASEVAIVEPSWVPAENAQAIGRAHRLGQRDNVLASFLYIPGTLDQTIMRVFRRKAADIDAFNWETPGDQSNREENNHVIREAHHPGQPAVSV